MSRSSHHLASNAAVPDVTALLLAWPALGVSPVTVNREWVVVRAWLRRELEAP